MLELSEESKLQLNNITGRFLTSRCEAVGQVQTVQPERVVTKAAGPGKQWSPAVVYISQSPSSFTGRGRKQ